MKHFENMTMEHSEGKVLYRCLKKHAEGLGLDLTEEQLQVFLSYYILLAETNKIMNLTAITDPEEAAVRHFLDSAAPLLCSETKERFRKEGTRILDMGTGAGFPGMPLAILLPLADVTLADSLQKRTKFLESVKTENHLSKITICAGRAEDLARDPGMRESYDIVVARAVADLPLLCEYCLPFVKCGGIFAAWKGPTAKEETERAKNAVQLLGGSTIAAYSYHLPETDAERWLVVIEKGAATPEKYPRRAGIPAKRPL